MQATLPPFKDGDGNINLTRLGVFNGACQVNIVAKLSGYLSILKVEMYTLLLAIEHTQPLTTYT